MHKKINGLPVWAFRAANALRNGYPISEVLEYYEVEFAPNNIRTVLSARDDDRVAKHHDHAVHIALLSSEGSDVDYAQSLVRWTAIETA